MINDVLTEGESPYPESLPIEMFGGGRRTGRAPLNLVTEPPEGCIITVDPS